MRALSTAGMVRERSLPRFALRKTEAAAALGISPSLFDDWIEQGKMPKGKKIIGVVLWDVDRLWDAWRALDSDDPHDDSGKNPFDQMVV